MSARSEHRRRLRRKGIGRKPRIRNRQYSRKLDGQAVVSAKYRRHAPRGHE